MKKIVLLLLIAPLSVYGEARKAVKSTIESVTVYQQGAQIHRRAYYSISKGLTVISIENISAQIDPKSIQVEGTGEMVILDSKYKVRYPEPLPVGTVLPMPKLDREIQQINDSLLIIDYDLMRLQQKLEVLNTQKTILANNGAIKGVGKVNDSIPLLKEALNYYYQKMNLINSEVIDLTIQKNFFTTTKVRMQARLQEIYTFKNNAQNPSSPNQSPIRCIEITLSANASVSGKLELSYLVNGAGWTPLYDIRSHSDKKNIDLTYKAQVYQNTGIDWIDANLTLSTTNPYTNKTKPILTPFYVAYTQQHAYNNIKESDKKSQYRAIESLSPTNALQGSH